MNAQTRGGSYRQRAAILVPILVLPLAGLAVRTSLATAHPLTALLLFLWIVADTMMLSLVARTAGKPGWHAVLGVLAGACFTVAVAAPPVIRQTLWTMPIPVGIMAMIVLAHVGWATMRAARILTIDGASGKDRWVSAASEFLPPALVRLATAELMILHIALFRWGGPADVPAHSRAFAYHKHLTPMCATLLILSAIEIAVYHLLVGHWSRIAAIVMFVLSDVGFLYLVGLIKSFRFRPVLMTPEGVCIRAGFLIDQAVTFDNIAAVETHISGEQVRDPATLNAALLAWPNIVLTLVRPMKRRFLLTRKRAFDRIAFRLDDPEPFVRLLRWRLGQTSG